MNQYRMQNVGWNFDEVQSPTSQARKAGQLPNISSDTYPERVDLSGEFPPENQEEGGGPTVLQDTEGFGSPTLPVGGVGASGAPLQNAESTVVQDIQEDEQTRLAEHPPEPEYQDIPLPLFVPALPQIAGVDGEEVTGDGGENKNGGEGDDDEVEIGSVDSGFIISPVQPSDSSDSDTGTASTGDETDSFPSPNHKEESPAGNKKWGHLRRVFKEAQKADPKEPKQIKAMEIFTDKKKLRATIGMLKWSKLILRPDHTIRKIWDIIQVFTLLYVAAFVPLRVGLDIPSTGGWFIIDFLMDLYYIADVVLNFYTAYEHPEEQNVYIYNPKMIAKHYLKTWFLFDALACAPVDLCLNLMQGTFVCSIQGDCTDSPPNEGQLFRLFKIFRLARMVKLLRLLHVMKVMQPYQDGALFHVVHYFALVKQIVFLAFIGHLTGCMFYYASSDQFRTFDEKDRVNDNTLTPWIEGNFGSDPRNASIVSRYIASVYWSFQTLQTVGYGDIPAQTLAERIYAIVGMVLGGFYFSYIIGSMSNILNAVNRKKITEDDRMLKVHAFLSDEAVPVRIRHPVMAFFRRQPSRSAHQASVLMKLPFDLRLQVIDHIYSNLLTQCQLFRGCSDLFKSSVMMHLEVIHFAKGDIVMQRGDVGTLLYFVDRGQLHVLNAMGQIRGSLRPGSYFGEGCLFGEPLRVESVRTHQASVVYAIDAKKFLVVLEHAPHLMAVLSSIWDKRKAALKVDANQSVNSAMDGNLGASSRTTDRGPPNPKNLPPPPSEDPWQVNYTTNLRDRFRRFTTPFQTIENDAAMPIPKLSFKTSAIISKISLKLPKDSRVDLTGYITARKKSTDRSGSTRGPLDVPPALEPPISRRSQPDSQPHQQPHPTPGTFPNETPASFHFPQIAKPPINAAPGKPSSLKGKGKSQNNSSSGDLNELEENDSKVFGSTYSSPCSSSHSPHGLVEVARAAATKAPAKTVTTTTTTTITTTTTTMQVASPPGGGAIETVSSIVEDYCNDSPIAASAAPPHPSQPLTAPQPLPPATVVYDPLPCPCLDELVSDIQTQMTILTTTILGPTMGKKRVSFQQDPTSSPPPLAHPSNSFTTNGPPPATILPSTMSDPSPLREDPSLSIHHDPSSSSSFSTHANSSVSSSSPQKKTSTTTKAELHAEVCELRREVEGVRACLRNFMSECSSTWLDTAQQVDALRAEIAQLQDYFTTSGNNNSGVGPPE